MPEYAVKIPMPDKEHLGVYVLMADGFLPGSDYIAVRGRDTATVAIYLEALKERIVDALKEVRNA